MSGADDADHIAMLMELAKGCNPRGRGARAKLKKLGIKVVAEPVVTREAEGPGLASDPGEPVPAKAPKFATVAKLTPEELAGVADSIRALEADNVGLSDKTVANVITIAKHLGDVRESFGWGRWLPWLKTEFNWSLRTSSRYWSVYQLMQIGGPVRDLDQLKISVSVLYLLADLRLKNPNALAKIVALARAERVTVERAKELMVPSESGPAVSEARNAIGLAQKEREIRKENAITRVMTRDLPTPFGMQVFKNALATMSEEQILTIVAVAREELAARKQHPSRFEPMFDVPAVQ